MELIKLPKIHVLLLRLPPPPPPLGLVPRVTLSMLPLVLQRLAKTSFRSSYLSHKSQNFVNVASVDNQGKVVPGTGNGGPAPTAAPAPNTDIASPTSAAAPTASPATGNNGGIGNFGKCSVPQIEFAAGIDGRRETSFQPVDKGAFIACNKAPTLI